MIECLWAKENRFKLGHDGNVYPCCYFSNAFISQEYYGTREEWAKNNAPIIEYYLENIERFNIKNMSFDQIIKDPFYRKMLEQSFTEAPAQQCVAHCTKQPEIIAKSSD